MSKATIENNIVAFLCRLMIDGYLILNNSWNDNICAILISCYANDQIGTFDHLKNEVQH